MNIRACGKDWWLRTGHLPIEDGYLGSVAVVQNDGFVADYDDIDSPYIFGARPALLLSNLEETDYKVWDKFKFAGEIFTIISKNYALCDDIVGGTRAFGNGIDYEESDIKKFVDSWFRKHKNDSVEKLNESKRTGGKEMSKVNSIVNKILEGADVRKMLSEVNSSISQEIPEEYIKHYSGELGEFDYDIREFELDDGWLHYIGSETDGSKIKIPNGVKDCSNMFYGCKLLIKAPVIPNSVESCEYMFEDCISLIKAPVIPNGVKTCNSMFYNCTSLKTAPVILNGVKDCEYMFRGCISLTKAPVIPNSVKNCRRMFDDCSKEVQEAGKWNIAHRGQSYYDQN